MSSLAWLTRMWSWKPKARRVRRPCGGRKGEVSSGIRRSTMVKRYFPTILSRSLMANDGLMVSVSGIRGRVGEALTPEVVARYAAGFGAWSKRRTGSKTRIVVGRDSRVSGPMFHRVVLAALQSVGCDVIDIGLTTTPTCQLAVESHHAAGGLMISASHNPIEWNALKFIGSSGLFLEASEGAEMRSLVEQGIPRATWDQLGTVTQDERAIERHLERVLAIPYL